MFCTECGAQTDESAKFCAQCGMARVPFPRKGHTGGRPCGLQAAALACFACF